MNKRVETERLPAHRALAPRYLLMSYFAGDLALPEDTSTYLRLADLECK